MKEKLTKEEFIKKTESLFPFKEIYNDEMNCINRYVESVKHFAGIELNALDFVDALDEALKTLVEARQNIGYKIYSKVYDAIREEERKAAQVIETQKANDKIRRGILADNIIQSNPNKNLNKDNLILAIEYYMGICMDTPHLFKDKAAMRYATELFKIKNPQVKSDEIDVVVEMLTKNPIDGPMFMGFCNLLSKVITRDELLSANSREDFEIICNKIMEAMR